MRLNIRLISIASVLGLLIAASSFAFTGPTANPPTGGGAIGAQDSAPQNSLYITSAGNVGIATTTANQRLYVAGNATITGTISGTYTGTISAANVSAGSFGSNTGGGNYTFIANLTVDTNTFYVDATNDRVGVGLTNPTTKFEVFGGDATIGSRAPGHAYIQNFASSAVSPTYAFYARTTTGMFMPADYEIGFSTGSAGGEKVRITSAGKVGIATTTPSEELHVIGDAIVSGTITAGTFSGALSGTVSAANVSSGSFGSNTGGGNYTFPANLTVDTSTFFVDSTNDRVGIGTTTPSTLLSVATSTNIFNVTTGGNVGIGTANPSGRLHINSGQLLLPAGTAAAPPMTIGGDNTTGFYRTGIDEWSFSVSGTPIFSFAAGNLKFGSARVISWTPTADPVGTGEDLIILRDAANIFAQRNVTNAQEFRVYNTFTSATNYELGKLEWASNLFNIGTEKGGAGGTARALAFLTDNTEALRIDTSQRVGIGTTTPSTLLSVATSTNIFNVTTGGNVGIGTATPSVKLQVEGCGTTCVIIGGGSGKIDAGTIDPVYTIGNGKFATYLPAMTGVKEETTGVALLRLRDANLRIHANDANIYEHVIDFSRAERGSDLWLFWQTTDFGENWERLTVLLTPAFDGKAWYEKKPQEKKLVIYGTTNYQLPTTNSHLEVSYRLTASRFDHEQWPNTSDSPSSGFVLLEK